MKRRIFILIAFVLLLLLAVSCENPSKNGQSANTTHESSTVNTPTAELPDGSAVEGEESESETTKKNDSGAVWTPFY